jgi:hypothetical protein
VLDPEVSVEGGLQARGSRFSSCGFGVIGSDAGDAGSPQKRCVRVALNFAQRDGRLGHPPVVVADAVP